jgi:starch phosphorylase
MAKLTPEFSATRSIREYTEDHYLPAAFGYRERAAGDSALGVTLLHWQREIDQHWCTVQFGPVRIETHDGQHFFRVEVSSGTLTPDQLQIELYADSVLGSKPTIEVMTVPDHQANSLSTYIYSAQVPDVRPASDYTVRIIPHHSNASVPLEAEQILWQR